jgi:hypothetical protein
MSAIRISLSQPQSNPFKRLPLYLVLLHVDEASSQFTYMSLRGRHKIAPPLRFGDLLGLVFETIMTPTPPFVGSCGLRTLNLLFVLNYLNFQGRFFIGIFL